MSKKIIVLAIPGIGTHEENFSADFKKDVIKFSKNTPLEGNFILKECLPFSATQIDKRQNELFNRLDKENKMGGMLSLRRFVMGAFGDGVTFERDAIQSDSPYQKIHRYLRNTIEEINALMKDYSKAKLIIVSSSLGVHILSTYIWDADNNRGIFANTPATDNNNLRNLSYLATIGCNIPLFVSGLTEDQIVAIDKRNPEFTWDNYYDKDDVLGWPLKQMSPSYQKLVKDYEINTGLYAGSHVKYWDDNSFTRPFTRKILELYNSI